MKVIKQSIKVILRVLGHLVQPYNYLNKICFAHHLFCLFKKFEIDCVFDVGANLGLYRNFLRTEVGYRGLIVSFEPVRKNVERLNEMSKHDSNWIIFDFALGNQEGQKVINVMQSHELSSFLKPDTSKVPDYNDLNRISYEESVSIKRLDDIFDNLKDQYGFARPFLKIDTQGFDLEVLKGASRIMNQFHAIQTEASARPLYLTMPGFVELNDYLTERDFALSGMNPVILDRYFRLVEFDWIFINQSLCK